MTILQETKRKILNKISEKAIHGYQLANEVDVSVTGIYQHLKDLETEGLIKSVKKERKKIYRITEKGKKFLELIRG